jgi:hypothetical protein
VTTEIPIALDRDAALSALQEVLVGLRDGSLTPARAAELLDAVVDTGPFDGVDDPVFRLIVDAIAAVVPDGVSLWELLDRDPAAMRARAARVEASNPERAARIRSRADRVEARQS